MGTGSSTGRPAAAPGTTSHKAPPHPVNLAASRAAQQGVLKGQADGGLAASGSTVPGAGVAAGAGPGLDDARFAAIVDAYQPWVSACPELQDHRTWLLLHERSVRALMRSGGVYYSLLQPLPHTEGSDQAVAGQWGALAGQGGAVAGPTNPGALWSQHPGYLLLCRLYAAWHEHTAHLRGAWQLGRALPDLLLPHTEHGAATATASSTFSALLRLTDQALLHPHGLLQPPGHAGLVPSAGQVATAGMAGGGGRRYSWPPGQAGHLPGSSAFRPLGGGGAGEGEGGLVRGLIG